MLEGDLDRIKRVKQAGMLVLAVYLACYYAFLFWVKPGNLAITSDLMSPLGMFLSLSIMLFAVKHQSGRPKKIWILFICGTLAFILGDLQFAYDELLKKELAFPSMADFYYTISSTLLLIAFFLHIPHKSKFATFRNGLDILIVMVIYLSLEAKYILMPLMNNMSLSISAKIASLMYPFFDAGLFVAILLLYFNDINSKEQFKSKLMILVAGVWLVTDQLYSYQTVLGTYKSGNWYDPLWAASFLLLSIIALKSAEFYGRLAPLAGQDQFEESNEKNIKKQIVITYISLLVFISIWFYNYFQKEPLSIGGIIIIFLIILRQFISLMENRRLLKLLIVSNENLIEANSRIEYELQTDYLTRMFNRRYIDGALSSLQASTDRNPSEFSVLVMDIDHFKEINDRYGHSTGDHVLKQIAVVIEANIRKNDIAGRWGGEEFIILLPETDENTALTIAERIRSEIMNYSFRSETGQELINISVSIGISEHTPAEDDYSRVVLRADQGMYEAKSAGRNRSVIKRPVEA